MGKFRPRASKRKNKRTIHFALVVYKDADSCQKVLEDSKFLQAKVNKAARGAIGFAKNPFLDKNLEAEEQSDSEISETDIAARENKVKMQEGGFTLVEADAYKPTRIKARDAFENVMKGVS
jgi:hypothetical protein